MKQVQFLEVLDEQVAHERFAAATFHLQPRAERIPLDSALGRVLERDVVSPVDVPGFDRSNMDGYAVQAADTAGAEEMEPVLLAETGSALAAGDRPSFELTTGRAVAIATGAMMPRGADAVVMIENTLPAGESVGVLRPVYPGENVTFAGSDIGRGDVVARRGSVLTSRETGVLAAVGVADVDVVRRPRVAVLSTGDEIVPPGADLQPGMVYDSNQRILLDAASEAGCEGVAGGILPDDFARVEAAVEALIGSVDVLLLSGGTSKGEGDVNATVVARLADRLPDSEVVAHGVALKPGKPLQLSVLAGTPVVVLPGFPTSAIFTFHEFVAPLLRRMAGLPADSAAEVEAIVPMRIDSTPGRAQYVLVDLVAGGATTTAYPLGAGSGSVTAFAMADGFIRIPAATEYVEAGSAVTVRLVSPGVEPADLAVVGSHCVGFDYLLSRVAEDGFRVKAVWVGSMGGIGALRRGEGDLAGIHVMNESGEYNRSFVPEGSKLVKGYRRRQGIAFRADNPVQVSDPRAFIAAAIEGGQRMVNRNTGSGTRLLIDRLLEGLRPDGYLNQARTHHAVAAAIEQGRADWGVTLDTIAKSAGLGFLFVQDEEFDFLVREARQGRPAVVRFFEIFADPDVRSTLVGMGFGFEGEGPLA